MATPCFLGTRRNGYRSGSTCRSAHFGKLDVVINNAGYTLVATVEEASEANIRALFDTNYLVRSGLGRVKTFWLEDVRTSRVGDCYGALAYACIAATSGRQPMQR